MELSKTVEIVPQVEIWLQNLSEEIKNTLKKLVIDCLQNNVLNLNEFPAQVIYLSIMKSLLDSLFS